MKIQNCEDCDSCRHENKTDLKLCIKEYEPINKHKDLKSKSECAFVDNCFIESNCSVKKATDKNYNVRVHFREQGEDIADKVIAILKSVYINEYLKRRGTES